MLSERPMDAALKTALINNVALKYCHLIKFERPSRPDSSGKVSTSKERYTYLSDASRSVSFDDGSTDLNGTANGPQTYIPNKILKVSPVSEQVEAKANTYTINLDGTGIGAYYSGTGTVTVVDSVTWDIAYPLANLIDAGFREGDKITLSGFRTGDFNISKFRAAGTVRITKIDTTLTAGSGSLDISLSSEEIKSILLDKNGPEYSSFVNREVYIYRAYFDVDGVAIGNPLLIFKGIISGVGFDDTETGITVVWSLTSHWGDFAQVRGRITSDDFHRALDQNGIPQPYSTLKPLYAYDKGFNHAETSINLLSTYSVQVEKQSVKYKKGFLGIFGNKVIVKKYFVNEDRNTALDFQLAAKSIPVSYGVRTVTGIPIFADTLKTNSSKVYTAYALSEGEIGGIYDVIVNGKSLICNDKADFDARSLQTTDNTVDIICRGRADRGDVLGGVSSISGTTIDYYSTFSDTYGFSLGYNLSNNIRYLTYVDPLITTNNTTGKGVIHGESIHLTSPQDIVIDFFSGKTGQAASNLLVDIAKNKNFKVQNDYWTSTDTAEYWGPDHRLSDTAYAVVTTTIAEGETTLADLEFIVRGKVINCYNYDYSYSHKPTATSESEANFNLGDIVTLSIPGGASMSGVQIIDKWTFINPDGTSNTRFRWDSDAAKTLLNYNSDGIPTNTEITMTNGSSQTWSMYTHNYSLYSGTIATVLTSALTSASNVSTAVQFNYNSNTNLQVGNITQNGPSLRIKDASNTTVEKYYFNSTLLNGLTRTATSILTKYPYDLTGAEASTIAGTAGMYVVSANTIKLPSSASSVDDTYNGTLLKLIKYDASTGKQNIQESEITDYDGATRIATISTIWGLDQEPAVGDKVEITYVYADKRVSINPAIQTLDYVVNNTYGKGLDYVKDLNLASWLSTAAKCDIQSDVTVNIASGTPVAGDVYKYPASGTIIWQGKVSSFANNHVEFYNVLGKLTNKWNNWKSYKLGEIVYTTTKQYLVTIAGVKTTEPTHGSGTTVNGLQHVTALNLTRVSGSGSSTLTMVSDGNPVRGLKDGVRVSGYSLYDSDGVDYYRLLGWDEHSQRYVTKHQTNITLDTSAPLFDNTNTMLSHFGGILRYSAGQYYLDLEEASALISNTYSEPKNITADHIIGKIKLTDEGVRGAFNSLTVAYPDPANKFESRNISFFNSTYLKSDRNVPKKGNLTVPGITNYYNTRILADKFLNKSRYGLVISFNMVPRGLLLLSGMVVQIQYPRYGWVDKKFRIVSLTLQEDLTVDIVAEEYDDSFYSLSRLSKQAGSGKASASNITTIAAPTNLVATSIDTGDESKSRVQITWANNPLANTRNVYTEVYSGDSTQFYINVDSISSNVLTTSVAHELKVDSQITGVTNSNGLVKDTVYFVKSVPSSTSFTLSLTKGGAVLGVTNGSSLGIAMRTTTLIETVPVPISNVIDAYGGNSGRVIKYYWVRHKVIQE